MIAILGLAGLTCFMLVSVWVGVRLLLLARRTRQLPETLAGTSILLSGGVGLALSIAATVAPNLTPAEAHLAVRASILLSAAGYLALYIFVWVVFRRQAVWGRIVFGLCTLMLLVGTVGDLMTRLPGEQVLGPEAVLGSFGVLSVVSRLLAYGWASAESFSYYAKMNRRLAIGLAEESLVSRFWYWGICMSASFLIWVVMLVDEAVAQADVLAEISTVITALLGFVLAGSLHQAFFRKRGLESAVDACDANASSSRAV